MRKMLAGIVTALGLIVSAGQSFSATLTIENGAGAFTITHTSAWVGASVVSTGSANPSLWSYWGTNNATTNATQWQYTNAYGVSTQGTYSVQATNLTPATLYYYRSRGTNAVEGTDWASFSGVFRTLASPTSAPPSVVLSVMMDTNAIVRTPTNGYFIMTNLVYRYWVDSTNYISEVYEDTQRVVKCSVNGVIKTNITVLN